MAALLHVAPLAGAHHAILVARHRLGGPRRPPPAARDGLLAWCEGGAGGVDVAALVSMAMVQAVRQRMPWRARV